MFEALGNNLGVANKNTMPWWYLKGSEAEEFNKFAKQLYGENVISSIFRNNDFENTLKKSMLNNKSTQVIVFSFHKTGGFFKSGISLKKSEGLIKYANDSIGLGYEVGTHFMKVVKDLITESCISRGMDVVVEKEGVNPAAEVTNGTLPENYSRELEALIYKNKPKFDLVINNKKVNVLDLLGENEIIKVDCISAIIPADKNIQIDQAKEAIRVEYEEFKFNKLKGKVEFGDLLKKAQIGGAKLPVKIYTSFEENQKFILNDFNKNQDIFMKSLTMLPEDYMKVLETAHNNGEISDVSYEYCKLAGMRFVDVKFSRPEEGLLCLNREGVRLAMEKAQRNPDKAGLYVGVTGADEISGQLVKIDGKAYNFSLDVNNLSGINTEYGFETGDQFITEHIKAFNDIRKMINEGKLTRIEDVFVEYYKIINSSKVKINRESISQKGIDWLKKKGVNVKGDVIETEIANLGRTYAKDKSLFNKMFHEGASATVVVTNIDADDPRCIQHTEEFIRDLAKKLKAEVEKEGGKYRGKLVIEVKEFNAKDNRLKSTYIKVDGGEIDVESVEKSVKPRETQKATETRTEISDEIFNAALNKQLSSGISKMSAADLSKELGIEEYKAERIITAAKGSINKQLGGNALSLVMGYAGMTAAGKLIDKFAPDMNPVLQFSAMVYTGHNINHFGLNIAESIKAGKLPKSLLDIKGGFKAMNPVTMGPGLAASGAWNLAMESLGVRNSALRNGGSTAAFFAPDVYKISAKYLAQRYGWKLLPSGRLAAAGQALAAIAITNFAFGMIGAGIQHSTLDSYNRSVVSRAADLYLQNHSKGWENLLFLPKRVTDALGAEAFTDIAYAQESEMKAIAEGDRQYAESIENALKITFGTTLLNGLNEELLSGGEFANLPLGSIEKGRVSIKENIKNLVKDKESRKMFEEWQSFLRLYSSANFMDVPKELIDLNIDKIENFIPSDNFIKWAARKGKLETGSKTIEILSIIKEAKRIAAAQKK